MGLAKLENVNLMDNVYAIKDGKELIAPKKYISFQIKQKKDRISKSKELHGNISK